MSHDSETCRRSVAYLSVTVAFIETVVRNYATVNPSVLSEVAIEDIVEVHSADNLFESCIVLSRIDSVTEPYGCGAVSWKGAVLACSIIEVLSADEVGMPYGLESLMIERGHAIEYD